MQRLLCGIQYATSAANNLSAQILRSKVELVDRKIRMQAIDAMMEEYGQGVHELGVAVD